MSPPKQKTRFQKGNGQNGSFALGGSGCCALFGYGYYYTTLAAISSLL
jgi:hypothetical protein